MMKRIVTLIATVALAASALAMPAVRAAEPMLTPAQIPVVTNDTSDTEIDKPESEEQANQKQDDGAAPGIDVLA